MPKNQKPKAPAATRPATSKRTVSAEILGETYRLIKQSGIIKRRRNNPDLNTEGLAAYGQTPKAQRKASALLRRRRGPYYSADPKYPGLIVETAEGGSRRLGRFVNRRFEKIDHLGLNVLLRDLSTGRLDANRIADLIGISRPDIAHLCGVSEQSLNENPANSNIQAKLQTLENVTHALLWCDGSETKFRAWLNHPDRDVPEADRQKLSPLDLILRGHAEIVAWKVHNLRFGHPS